MILSLACNGLLYAQEVTEVKGLRLYEHHSSDVTMMPFGSGAEGSKSGYDFVGRKYFGSFDENTMNSYSNGEEKNLDMVEHEGMFGTNGARKHLGFTAGVSTIWGGSIKGNGQTKWHKVTAGIAAYDAALTNANLIALYDGSKATLDIAKVVKNEVYVGRIRNSGLYVLIKCTGERQPFGGPDGSTRDNNYFDFDYKYTDSSPTGIAEEKGKATITVYPNPASDYLTIGMGTEAFVQPTFVIVDAMGKEVHKETINGNKVTIETADLKQGLYYVFLTSGDGSFQVSRSVSIVH